MAFGKRQLVLAALVVALGAAVYLNWQFSDQGNLLATDAVTSSALQTGKELGEAQYVNKNETSPAPSEGDAATASTTGGKMSTNAEQYFAQARVSRQKARDEAVDTLKALIADVAQSDAAKTEAVSQAAAIAKNIEQENNIENLVKAKGFAECVAFLQNGECSVVVSSEGLLESEAIAIKDIVAGQAAIPYEKIKIVEAK